MRKACFLLVFVLVPVVFGCTSTESRPELSRTRDGLTAILALDPVAPAAMKPVALLLTLRDGQGQAVEGARVSFDLTMPEMAMPKAQPEAAPEGHGLYRAETVFTMSGKWRIKAVVTRPGGEITFVYDIAVP